MAATTYQARFDEIVTVDPSVGPWTILTPANPSHGSEFAVKTINLHADVVTVDTTSLSIESIHTGKLDTPSTPISMQNGVCRWSYDSSLAAWLVVDYHAQIAYHEIYQYNVGNNWLPLPGTQQLLLTVSASGLIAQLPLEPLNISCQMTAEVTLSGNNQDVVFDWTPSITGGIDRGTPVYGSLSSPRSGIFLDTRAGVFNWEPALAGQIWDLDTNDLSGAGSSNRFEIQVVVELL